MTTHTLPFGCHHGKPLADVPTGYLQWVIAETKLSAGLAQAVADELQRRGLDGTLPPPAPFPIAGCRSCPEGAVAFAWAEDSRGRKRVRASCATCDTFLGTPPSRPPFSTLASNAASAAPVLDVLLACEAAGVQLASDGRKVWLPETARRKLPAEMRTKLRECCHQLAGMLGKNLLEMAP
jgi:uncharacterized protein (DUF3820 family)